MNTPKSKKPERVDSRITVLSRAKKLLTAKRTWQYFGVFILTFFLANLEVYIIHHGRTYSNTSVAGKHLGAIASAGLSDKIADMPLLPKEITLTEDKTSVKVSLADVDIKQDTSFTAERAMKDRSWLPIVNFFTGHDVPLHLVADSGKLQATVRKLLASTDKPATNAKIIKQDGSFSIKAETSGVALDVEATANKLLDAVEKGKTTVAAVTEQVAPEVTSQSLQPKLATLQSQLKTSVTYQYEGKTKKLSATDIAAFYTEETEGTKDSTGVALSDIAIQNNVIATGSGFGIGVQNLTDAVAAVKSAVTNQKTLTFTLTAKPFGKVYSYCTSTRGVNTSELPELSKQLKIAFSDNRGWNLGGLVKFQPANSGCDFTVWLAAADQMPSFGAICDAEWSCSVPPNVVINYDRWRYTTEAWKKANGNLDDYRTMVINHETGHWLGFYHDVCRGAGQPAPVMQQQSIDLQGCAFNPWPTPSEQAALKQRLGL